MVIWQFSKFLYALYNLHLITFKYHKNSFRFLYTISPLYLYTLILLNLSCQKEIDLNLPEAEEQIVVDGYIENNAYPYVVLTRSVPFFSEIDSVQLRSLVVTTAKVTVTCDSVSEILTLQPNEKFFPPYVYRGTTFKGEAGKKYSLKVEVSNKVITANTSITNKASIDSIWFEPLKDNDTLGLLWMQIQDNPNESDYYRVLTKRKGKDSNYIPSMIFSAFSDINFNGKLFKIAVYKGITDFSHPLEDIYFNIKDTVNIRLSTMDKESYNCWMSLQNEMVNYGNPLAEPNNPIVTNITNGIGVWTGFGSNYYVYTPR